MRSKARPVTDLPWQPGGERGGDKSLLKDGEQFLMVVRLAGRLCGGPPFLDYHVVEVEHGPNGVVFHSNGWTWTWDDVFCCLPMSQIKLPEELR